MKAAIYARISSQGQAEDELDILGQIEECKKYAREKGYQIVKVFEDAGIMRVRIEKALWAI